MVESKGGQDEEMVHFSFLNYDLSSIVLGVTFFSVILSFIFNGSYFLTFDPNLLMLFSPSDYLSTGVYCVVLVFSVGILMELHEYQCRRGFSRKNLERKLREREEKEKKEEESAKLDKELDRISKEASSREELLEAYDKLYRPMRRELFQLRMGMHIISVFVWLVFAFPRVDWLAAAIILNLISFYSVRFGLAIVKDKSLEKVLSFSRITILVTFYAGAVYTATMPVNYNSARVTYEQNGQVAETSGKILRVLSKSVIIRTQNGIVILDRDTPLQIFHDGKTKDYDTHGFWWFIRRFDEAKKLSQEGDK